MKKKKTLEELINDFLEEWEVNKMYAFIRDIKPLYELYDIGEKDDPLQDGSGKVDENVRTVRLVRTVYLLSRIADFHAGKFCSIKYNFKELWKKMEKYDVGQIPED